MRSHSNRIARGIAPLFALAATAALTGCGPAMLFSTDDGVPLDELDLSAGAPEQIVLAGPDRVEIMQGARFDIAVSGQGTDDLRFTYDDGSLGISRKNGMRFDGDSGATVRITTPTAPGSLSIAGSGTMRSALLAPDADVAISGSGTLETPGIAAERLEVSIAGSGDYRATGSARSLEISIAGSGDAGLEGLEAGDAEVRIAGSGDVRFAATGKVDATIMGSGDVTVTGNARCTVTAMGSGTLTCNGTVQND